MCWQELPPPGGEVTVEVDGDDGHPMAPRAIPHRLSVCPTSSYPMCYHFTTQKGPTFTWSSSENRCLCWQEMLALQRKLEKRDESNGCTGACSSGPVTG